MPDEPDETLDGELETDDEPKLAGAAATSALRKDRKARQESERELRDLRARYKKIEDAEKSETERLRAEVDELRSERETEQAQVTAEREQRSKRDVVRRAAAEFAGGDVQAAELQADLGQRHLRSARLAEQLQHVAADVMQEILRIRRRHGRGDDMAVPVHRDGAGGQLLHACAAAKKSF